MADHNQKIKNVSGHTWLHSAVQGESFKLRVTVKQCDNLKGVDNHGSSSDPFVKVGGCVPPIETTKVNWYKTQTIKKNCNPSFNETFTFDNDIAVVKIEVWDWNRFQKDVLIGHCEISLYEEDDFVREGWPDPIKTVSITRSLGNGAGTINLDFNCNYESKEHYYTREADETKKKSVDWPLRNVKLSNGTINFRLPDNVKLCDKPPGFHAMFKSDNPDDFFDRKNMVLLLISEKDMANNCEISIDELQKINEEKVIPEVLKVQCNSVDTKERGVTKIGGVDSCWFSLWADYTANDNIHPFSAVSTQYVLPQTLGKDLRIMISTYYSWVSKDNALENHHEMYAKMWSGFINSITIVPN